MRGRLSNSTRAQREAAGLSVHRVQSRRPALAARSLQRSPCPLSPSFDFSFCSGFSFCCVPLLRFGSPCCAGLGLCAAAGGCEFGFFGAAVVPSALCPDAGVPAAGAGFAGAPLPFASVGGVWFARD